MQKYECKLCEYFTDRMSNLERHNDSSRHKKMLNENDNKRVKNVIPVIPCHPDSTDDVIPNNEFVIPKDDTKTQKKVSKPDKYVCEYCNYRFASRQSHNRHVHNGCKMKDKNNQIPAMENNLMFLTMFEEFKKMIQKNEQILEKIQTNGSDVLKTTSEAIKSTSEAMNATSKTADRSMKIASYAMKHFKNAPHLSKIDSNHAALMLEYIPEHKNDKHTADEYIVYRYKKDILVEFIGDIIINYYKKDNPKEQSFWEVDITRLIFIIKDKPNDNAKSEWIKDKNGIKIMVCIIDPLCREVREMMLEYMTKIDKMFKRETFDPYEAERLGTDQGIASEIKDLVIKPKFKKKVLRYIAPHFGFNPLIADIVDDYDSPYDYSNNKSLKLVSAKQSFKKTNSKTDDSSIDSNKKKAKTNKSNKKKYISSDSESSNTDSSSDKTIDLRRKKKNKSKKYSSSEESSTDSD
jgi:hypothetical protein